MAAAGGCEIRSASGSAAQGTAGGDPSRGGQRGRARGPHRDARPRVVRTSASRWRCLPREPARGLRPSGKAAVLQGPLRQGLPGTQRDAGPFRPGGAALTRSPGVGHEQRLNDDAIQSSHRLEQQLRGTGSWARARRPRPRGWLNCACLSLWAFTCWAMLGTHGAARSHQPVAGQRTAAPHTCRTRSPSSEEKPGRQGRVPRHPRTCPHPPAGPPGRPRRDRARSHHEESGLLIRPPPQRGRGARFASIWTMVSGGFEMQNSFEVRRVSGEF